MKRFLLGFLFIVGCASAAPIPASPEDVTAERIDAVVGLLDEDLTSFCAGSMLATTQVLTAAHCVGDVGDSVSVGLHQDYNELTGWSGVYGYVVQGTNPTTDLAVLTPVNEVPARSSLVIAPDDPEVGDYVVAVGHPSGLAYSVSYGRLVSLWRYMDGAVFYQASAPVSPGNSGGPLLNYYGEIVGVTSWRIRTEPHLAGFCTRFNIIQLLESVTNG